jgi:hypothetical protein
MKRSRFSEEQIIAILRKQEAGAKTAEVRSGHCWGLASRLLPRRYDGVHTGSWQQPK